MAAIKHFLIFSIGLFYNRYPLIILVEVIEPFNVVRYLMQIWLNDFKQYYSYSFIMTMLLVWARLEQTNAINYPCNEGIIFHVRI
jgi:hypothetical protein